MMNRTIQYLPTALIFLLPLALYLFPENVNLSVINCAMLILLIVHMSKILFIALRSDRVKIGCEFYLYIAGLVFGTYFLAPTYDISGMTEFDLASEERHRNEANFSE